MTVKRGGLAKQKRGRTPKSDKLATTPTQYGETSPDYVAQAGDPDWMKSYSEEQIGLSGGRERMLQIVAARQRRTDESGSTEYGDTTFELGSSEAETAEVGAVPQDEIGTTDVASETKGKGKGAVKDKAKKPGTGKRGEKGGLYGRLAKATGTTRKEGRGIMKRARRQIRSGNTKAGARRITRALAGGPKAGVKRTPARAAQAQAAGKKIAKRIATRQRAGGGGGRPKKKK